MTAPVLEVLLSPDKFKGSLTAIEVSEALESGISKPSMAALDYLARVPGARIGVEMSGLPCGLVEGTKSTTWPMTSRTP